MTEENILTLPEGVNPLLRRAVLFLESGDFASAGDYCGKVLDAEPENPIAYLVKLMGDNNIQNEKQLVFLSGLPENKDFKFARRFASPELAAKLDAILAENERNLALAPLRAACAARQQQLRQFLDGGVFSGQAVEVQNRIAAEQKFMLAPSEDAAAKEIAATNALIDGIRKSPELRAACAARQRQLRQLLEGGVSPEEANEVQNRIEAEQKLMLVPSEDGAAKETAATNALIDRIGKIRKLRAACATRQQQLRQLLDLDGGLPPEEATEVQNRIEAEQKFMLAPSEDGAAKETAATNALIDGIGKIRERIAEQIKTEKRRRNTKFALIGIGAVVLLIIIILSICAISQRVYINTELEKARAAWGASQWSEVVDHARNVLSKDADNAEAKALHDAAERIKAEEEAHRFVEAVQKKSPSVTLRLPGDVKLELARVNAGTFTMGARDGENDKDEVPHRVTLTRDFYLGKTEVTQAQWKAVMGDNPSRFKGDDLPVERVSWNDAMEFCNRLNEQGKAPDGWKFTLPTEAQWEYAARGGNQSRGYKYSGSDSPHEVAWYDVISGVKTHPVATKQANELGMYDMSGNVWEWCLDCYGPSYGSCRVGRGGDCLSDARSCRSASRRGGGPGFRVNDFGFRLALVPVR